MWKRLFTCFFGDLQMLLKYKYAMLFIVIESCKMQKKEKKNLTNRNKKMISKVNLRLFF